VPDAIFVTAMESDPWAVDAAAVIGTHSQQFQAGVAWLKHLTDGPVYVCQAPGPTLAPGAVTFAGPHPAGLPGTHIHHLHPVDDRRQVWHLNYQDTIAIGHLVTSGRPWTDRIVALAGPGARQPGLRRTWLGASLAQLSSGQLLGGPWRLLSGSVLSGRVEPFLGRYHLQVSVLAEARPRRNSRWAARVAKNRRGTVPTALVPLASFDRIMPLDLLVVPLLRALSVGDCDTAQRLGCLELIEEDLALASYLCPAGNDYGRLLRNVLDDILADRAGPE
jgi:Na+-transporting NADH:ubiquinone oxidoreductase subunit A